MKKVVVVLLMGLSWNSQVWGKLFSVSKTEMFNKRADEIKEIILDIENTCEKGCRYKVSNLREIRMVEKLDENRHFNWYYIDNVKDSSMYNLVEVTNPTDGEIHIRSRFPSSQQLKYLREKYSYGHRTYFDEITSSWIIKENYDQNNNFVNTTVSYSTQAESDSTVIRMFGSKVRGEMQRTAEEMFHNFTL